MTHSIPDLQLDDARPAAPARAFIRWNHDRARAEFHAYCVLCHIVEATIDKLLQQAALSSIALANDNALECVVDVCVDLQHAKRRGDESGRFSQKDHKTKRLC